MPQTRARTELRQFFAIKTDLLAAVRAETQDDIIFHLHELAVMQMHTASDRLRQGCAAIIASHHTPAPAAAQA
jgi:hypothetical protein